MTKSEQGNVSLSNRFLHKKGKSVAEAFECKAANRAGVLADRRIVETENFTPRTVKSLAVLSVRDRSSGNSAAAIPHKRRHTNAEATALPQRSLLLTIV